MQELIDLINSVEGIQYADFDEWGAVVGDVRIIAQAPVLAATSGDNTSHFKRRYRLEWIGASASDGPSSADPYYALVQQLFDSHKWTVPDGAFDIGPDTTIDPEPGEQVDDDEVVDQVYGGFLIIIEVNRG